MLVIKKRYLGKGIIVSVQADGTTYNIALDNPLQGQIYKLPKEFTEELKKEK